MGLQNKIIISTRPLAKDDELKKYLSENGAFVIDFPLIEIIGISIDDDSKKIIENLKNDIDKIVEEKFRSKSEELNKELEKIKAHGLSGAFFLQGRAQIDEKDYTGSLLSYTRAARYFMICEDLTNLRSSLTAINNICLTNMTYKALIQLSRIKGTGLNKLLNDLENKEYGGAFSDLITKIKENIYRLKIAEEPPKQ